MELVNIPSCVCFLYIFITFLNDKTEIKSEEGTSKQRRMSNMFYIDN